jgi:hypothetical protein
MYTYLRKNHQGVLSILRGHQDKPGLSIRNGLRPHRSDGCRIKLCLSLVHNTSFVDFYIPNYRILSFLLWLNDWLCRYCRLSRCPLALSCAFFLGSLKKKEMKA